MSLVWLEGEIDSKLFWVYADRQTDEWTMVILEVFFQLKIYCRDNGFALFNGKVNTSEKECYQVSSSEAGWDRHTVLNMWGMDIDNLVPDLSSASKRSNTVYIFLCNHS